MGSFIKNNFIYYALYLLVLCVVTYYLLNYDKITLHQMINSNVGNPAVDVFYKYFTHLGDGVFAMLVAGIFMWFNIRNGLYVLVSYALSGGITSLLKNYVFIYDRPHFVFGYYHKLIKLKFVEGVEMIGQNSFPSGHATTAFAIYTCMALMVKNKFLKVVLLTIAVNAAYSRTYLSQHWLVDIYAGSLIGISIATFMYFLMVPKNKFTDNINRPLFILKK